MHGTRAASSSRSAPRLMRNSSVSTPRARVGEMPPGMPGTAGEGLWWCAPIHTMPSLMSVRLSAWHRRRYAAEELTVLKAHLVLIPASEGGNAAGGVGGRGGGRAGTGTRSGQTYLDVYRCFWLCGAAARVSAGPVGAVADAGPASAGWASGPGRAPESAGRGRLVRSAGSSTTVPTRACSRRVFTAQADHCGHTVSQPVPASWPTEPGRARPAPGRRPPTALTARRLRLGAMTMPRPVVARPSAIPDPSGSQPSAPCACTGVSLRFRMSEPLPGRPASPGRFRLRAGTGRAHCPQPGPLGGLP